MYNNNNNNNNPFQKNVYTGCPDSTYMEILEFVCVMTVILVSGFLIYLKMASGNALKIQEYAEKARLSEIRQKSAMSRYERPGRNNQEELGAWVLELANTAGFDPSQLFSDEMPAEIAKLLPLAKGFIEGGGLQKLLAGIQQPGSDELRKSI